MKQPDQNLPLPWAQRSLAAIRPRRRPVGSGGGWRAIAYTLRTARRVGFWRLWRAMRAKNACKTCAVGMGGQKGGMRNEAGHWPEVCKKSLQAMGSDLQAPLAPEFFARFGLRDLKAFTPRELEAAGRLAEPLYKGEADTHYRPITWEKALSLIATKLAASQPRETFFYASGRSSNEAGFLLQLFARLYGTNHVNNCSFYCHQASGVGMKGSIGTATATVELADLAKADVFFLIGGNPASNHPRLMTSLRELRRRGGQVVVINPLREPGLVNFRVPSKPLSLLFGSRIASLYLQPHAGGDLALLSGLAKELLERGAVDRAFIAAATEGWEEFETHLKSLDWRDIESLSGISRAQLAAAAEVYARSKRAVFAWTMGITHHLHGVANVQWIANLALMRGMIGKEGAGLLPIRGHSNVQGIGSVGFTPELKAAVLQRLSTRFGIATPHFAGYDTLACLNAAAKAQMRVAICLGGNLFGASPDALFAASALRAVDLVVYLNTTLNTGHAHGYGRETLILPVLARDEESQRTTQESMFNYVRLSDGGKQRFVGARSEVSVIADIAARVLPASPLNWQAMQNHEAIRQEIAAVFPELAPLATIDRTKQEFAISGRILHTPSFPTPSGKARFWPHALPERHEEEGALRLITLRSEGQFNTVVFEDEDLYRGIDRRDVILLNPEDIKRLGLKPDQRVRVESAVGAMDGIWIRAYNVKAGNAVMYYPEANVLVPQEADPLSRTPAFKAVPVRVLPAPQGKERVGQLSPRAVGSS